MKFKELREKYKSKYPAALVAAAVKIAIDMGGAMTPAVKKIEAMKRGLSDDPIVKDALRQANESVNEDYAQELDLAQKNIARLSKKESGQDQKDYQAVARALNQGNLGAVKKVIKGISTKEIQADILNVLVGYNDLIAKMYPKAMSGGKFKSGMTVDKMVKESVDLDESTKAYAASLEKMANDRKLKNISKKDRDILAKLADMMKNANEEVEEAKAPKAKGLNIYGSEISGLKNKKGRPHTVKPMNDKGKLTFRVTDEFGSFKTVDLKTFAKEFG